MYIIIICLKKWGEKEGGEKEYSWSDTEKLTILFCTIELH